MVLEIINAYWQLDLEYENFASIKVSRDASIETWNISKARFNNGLPGGEADREAQARAQYYHSNRNSLEVAIVFCSPKLTSVDS